MSYLKNIPLREFPELDGIRFYSIFLVVMHHLFFKSNPFFQWFTDHGWVGVDIFFGMSGFLITGLLIKEQERTGQIDLKNFWIKRMFRLWPSWLLALFLSITLVKIVGRNQPEVIDALGGRWWHYFLHFGNYSYILFGKIHTLFSHYWSLAVEEHFYILWPLILVSCKTRRQLFMTLWVLVSLSWGLRVYHLLEGHSEHMLSFSTHTRLDELLLGCFLAFFIDRIPKLRLNSEIVLTVLMLVLYALGLYFCKNNSSNLWLNSLTYTFIGLGNCLLLILVVKGNPRGIRKIFSSPVLAKLGVLSYGVYLIHLHVNYLVFPIFKKIGIESEILLAIVNLIVPFILAYFMYQWIDRPIAKLRHLKKKSKIGLSGETVHE